MFCGSAALGEGGNNFVCKCKSERLPDAARPPVSRARRLRVCPPYFHLTTTATLCPSCSPRHSQRIAAVKVAPEADERAALKWCPSTCGGNEESRPEFCVLGTKLQRRSRASWTMMHLEMSQLGGDNPRHKAKGCAALICLHLATSSQVPADKAKNLIARAMTSRRRRRRRHQISMSHHLTDASSHPASGDLFAPRILLMRRSQTR